MRVAAAILAAAAALWVDFSGAGPEKSTRAEAEAPRPSAPPSAFHAATQIAAEIGSRPAGGRGERRAHAYAAKRFRAAGLEVSIPRFRVPARGAPAT